MGKLISLKKFQEENTPHLSGKARCIACAHEWIAVAPIGEIWLECPARHGGRGIFKEHVDLGGRHYVCLCGNYLWAIHETHGLYCPSCGNPGPTEIP